MNRRWIGERQRRQLEIRFVRIRGNLEREFRLDAVRQDLGRIAVGVHFSLDDDDLPDHQHLRVLLPGTGKQDQVDHALNIFDGHEAHRLAGLSLVRTDAVNQAGHAHFLLVLRFGQLTGEIADDLGELFLIGRERMIREIQADQIPFPVEHLALVHIVDFGQDDGFHNTGLRAEERHLPGSNSLEM